MSDLTERLRNPHWVRSGAFSTLRSSSTLRDMNEAADEIERLRDELASFVPVAVRDYWGDYGHEIVPWPAPNNSDGWVIDEGLYQKREGGSDE